MPSDQPPLHVGRPNIGDLNLFQKLTKEMFESRWFSNNGTLVQQLEKQIAKLLDVRNCILVCNATVGLQIAAHALNLREEVIVPANTFVATAHAMQWIGLSPVLVDADPHTHCIATDLIESAITPRTSAIVATHLWGNTCNVEDIEKIAAKHNLATIYDAAHAFACFRSNRPIGNFGNCEVFSFHATKFFNTFEGGAITTNDDKLAADIRRTKNFGFSGTDQVNHLGTNGKMPEICAAMGIASLSYIDKFISCNRSHHLQYQQALSLIDGIRILKPNSSQKSNWQYVVIEINEHETKFSRDDLLLHLKSNNILARRYFYPGLHKVAPYRSTVANATRSFPVTENLSQTVLALPTGTAISTAEIEAVTLQIAKFANKHR